MRTAFCPVLVLWVALSPGCRETEVASRGATAPADTRASQAEATQVASQGETAPSDAQALHAEMAQAARSAEKYLHEGIQLLYNEDRSRVFSENAPSATAAFSKTLETLIAHELENPELYEIPEVVAGMVEYRARAYKERATSFLVQGKLDLYVKDLGDVVKTAGEFRPKVASLLADPSRPQDEWLQSLRTVHANFLQLEGNALAALGLHYRLVGDPANSEAYLRRAMEILPADDPTRAQIQDFLKEP